MKAKFIGFFRPNDEEVKALWRNAIFVFDTNILLNLYRYSNETKEEFYKILNEIRNRIWLPYQAASEYFNRRLKVIHEQENAYEEMLKNLKSVINEFKQPRKHPFLQEATFENLEKIINEVSLELENNKTIVTSQINNDSILEKLEDFFKENIGDEAPKEYLDSLIKEGINRFKNKIPPGYKDSEKKEQSPDDTKKYGDLIIWKQIIEKSKTSGKDIIFITDDRKEDWWLISNNKVIQPRPELIKEFNIETGHRFYMYQPDKFLARL